MVNDVSDDDEGGESGSPALERWREEKARLARIERKQAEHAFAGAAARRHRHKLAARIFVGRLATLPLADFTDGELQAAARRAFGDAEQFLIVAAEQAKLPTAMERENPVRSESDDDARS